MTNRFIEAWKANDRINEALLDYLNEVPVKSKTQITGLCQEFAQILHVRMMWLEENRVLTLTEMRELNVNKEEMFALRTALAKSGEAITTLIARCTHERRIKGFNSPSDFVNYLIFTESQSRNKIVLLLAYPN